MKYPIVPLGEICDFVYGDGLKETDRKGGDVPVYGSNGIVGWHDEAITKGETIIIGRKGSIGEVCLSKVPCWPIDTTYYIDKTKVPCDLTWLYYTLLTLDLTRLNKSAAEPARRVCGRGTAGRVSAAVTVRDGGEVAPFGVLRGLPFFGVRDPR